MRHNPLFIKREKRRYPTIHWSMPELRGVRTFCGSILKQRSRSGMTTIKEHVNCQRCLACMRLHGHLEALDYKRV